MKEITKHSGKRSNGLAGTGSFLHVGKWSQGHVLDQNGPPGIPRKRALFLERGRKRMKEWGEVTFMKEWVKALDNMRILAPTHLQNLVSFPRYGRLKKKKSQDKIFPNSKYIFLFIELSESYFAGHF